MVGHRTVMLFVVILLASAALAGCLGGGDGSPSDDPGDGGDGGGGGGGGGSTPSDPDGIGGVAGIVLDDGFAPVHGANVRLTQDGNTVEHASTGADGRFEFDEIPTGNYRLQATASCCKETVERVKIRADETISRDLRMERLSTDEEQRPFRTRDEWTGFLGCGVNLLGLVKEAPCTLDENHNPEYLWNVTQGLRTLYLYVDWETQDLGEQLLVDVSAPGGDFVYTNESGTPPMHVRVDNDAIDQPAMQWENIEGQMELRIRVLPGGDAGLVYQQEFDITILEFHWRHAPDSFEYNPEE